MTSRIAALAAAAVMAASPCLAQSRNGRAPRARSGPRPARHAAAPPRTPRTVHVVPAALPAASPSTPDRHVLRVSLDPAAGTVRGTDSITTAWSRTFSYQLHDGMTSTVSCQGQRLHEATGARPPSEAGRHVVQVPHTCAGSDGRVTLDVDVDGRIQDPIEQETSLHFVTGDRTSGLISPDGVFLAGGTLWYPETGRLALFDLTADVPSGWSVVSQGAATRAEGAPPSGQARFRFASDVPADGLALSAGPFVVRSRDHLGVTLSTYLLPEEAALSDLFLDAAAMDIDRLAGLVGPYPYRKFDVVENFFTTGYGFPSYTLLGRDVIRMGERALRPGYLDHEIAHVWFGNDVHVDQSQGNWCEGLVSYLTNYLATAELGPEEALAARRRVSQRYSVDVLPADDYAPARFTSKSDDASGSVGYGKVSMVFHLLRLTIGDDVFWKGLRSLVQAHAGQRASWDDLRGAFEASSGKDLRPFFAQWIGRAGLPRLALEGVTQQAGGVRGVIAQRGEPWTLDLDVAVTTVSGDTVTRRVHVAGASTPLSMDVPGPVARVTLDPAFDVPRRLEPSDLPASLGRTLKGDGHPPLIVPPDATTAEDSGPETADRVRALRELADLAARQGGTVMSAKDVSDADVKGSSILVLGGVSDNRIAARLAPAFLSSSGVDVEQAGSFSAGGRRWRLARQAVLASAPHPDRPGACVTLFSPNSGAAMEGARKIFFYGWDTWVALDGGLAQDRATDWPEDSATSVRLAEVSATGARSRLMATVRGLADPRLDGRDSTSRGSIEATRLVVAEMRQAGLAPFGSARRLPADTESAWYDAFAFDTLDLPQQPVLKHVLPDGRKEFLKIVPGHDWIELPAEITVASGSTVSIAPVRVPARVDLPHGLVFVGDGAHASFEGLELAGALAVILDASPPAPRGADAAERARDDGDGEVRRIVGWMAEARRRNAEGLLVLRPDADWPADPGLAIFPSLRPPDADTSASPRRAPGGPLARMREAVGERARREALPESARFPLFYAGKEVADALRRDGGLVVGKSSWVGQGVDARFNITASRVADRDVVGLVKGTDASADRVVLLSAHHDAVGELADGRFAQAAVDNASGVAVILEVARRLAERPARLGVVVATMGAEEWGLRGSTHLAGSWGADRPKIAAVVNVDSVGMKGQPFHVVGRSREPALAAVLERAAGSHGLEVGADIDRHADAWGSDHWPWVARDVPSVDVFQADYAILDSPDDTVDKVDPATLESVADAIEAAVRELAR